MKPSVPSSLFERYRYRNTVLQWFILLFSHDSKLELEREGFPVACLSIQHLIENSRFIAGIEYGLKLSFGTVFAIQMQDAIVTMMILIEVYNFRR